MALLQLGKETAPALIAADRWNDDVGTGWMTGSHVQCGGMELLHIV